MNPNVEEHNIDDDMDYEPLQNFEGNNSSSDSEEQSVGQSFQPIDIYAASISSSIIVACTLAETGSANVQRRGSKRKHNLPNLGYTQARGYLFQNHEESSNVSKDEPIDCDINFTKYSWEIWSSKCAKRNAGFNIFCKKKCWEQSFECLWMNRCYSILKTTQKQRQF
ncbi:uncharacterized protein LOC118205612 [Stegodyphus dumicola]|uniref:uncharacterized protein LOC118205612 n=1 Tax=Stegodyphus dumicola TaxID=202533 RepID=UPI0015A778E1|nr:uncharacterized protein LOC118205612 [Stegodyphus dumicola]